MFGNRWRLFRLLGIPISLDASWLIILALVTWTLASVFRNALPSAGAGSVWLLALATAVSFFVCIVLHELGHAVVARASGMPIRGITLFLFGGVAELEGEPPSAGTEFFMAIAGPLVSVVLAVIFWVLWAVGTAQHWAAEAIVFCFYLVLINTTVLIFNLVPAFPLDGGRVMRSILWGATGNLRRATRWASFMGQGFAWLLIFVGVMQFFMGDLVSGISVGLIGMFLNSAARNSYQQVLLKEALQGEPVSCFMTREPIVVSPTLDLKHWVDNYVYRYHRKVFPVAENGHLEGVVSTQALSRFPRTEWDHHAVAEVMTPDVKTYSISPNTDALWCWARCNALVRAACW